MPNRYADYSFRSLKTLGDIVEAYRYRSISVTRRDQDGAMLVGLPGAPCHVLLSNEQKVVAELTFGSTALHLWTQLPASTATSLRRCPLTQLIDLTDLIITPDTLIKSVKNFPKLCQVLVRDRVLFPMARAIDPASLEPELLR